MEIQEHRIIADITKQSFYEFVKEFWKTYITEEPVFNWHIEWLCDEMQEVAERVFLGLEKEYDLVINVPPGSTKSTICSQMFSAWVWTRMPHAQLIHISYGYDIATKDARYSRDIILSPLYRSCFPEVVLRKDQNAKTFFMNTQGGWRMAVGMDGQLTGLHGHFLVIDDPLNPKKALSEAEMLSTTQFMEQTLPTRKVNKAVTPMILIQQRLHQVDPAGVLIEKGQKNPGTVKHISFPGELTDEVFPTEARAYYKNGLFDPIRLPRKVLDGLQQELGEYGYASQILQSPVPLGGGMFKADKFNILPEYPRRRIVRLVRSWDKAGTAGAGAYTVGTLMGIDMDDRYWVLDVVRGRWAATEREQIIEETAEADGQEVEIRVEIEGGSGGKESGEGTVRRLAGFRVTAYHPTGDKEARAYNYASQVGAGNVFVLDRSWTKPFIEEHRFFPFGKYKDQVDTAADCFNALHKPRRMVGAIKLRPLNARESMLAGR